MKAVVVGLLFAFSQLAFAQATVPECATFRAGIRPQDFIADFTQKLKRNAIWELTQAFEQSGIKVTPNMFEWNIEPEFQFLVNGDQNKQIWSIFQKNGADRIVVHAPNKDYVFPVWPLLRKGMTYTTATCFESRWGNVKGDCITIQFEYVEGYNKFNALGEPTSTICKAMVKPLEPPRDHYFYQIRNLGKASPRTWEIAPSAVNKSVEVPITGHLPAARAATYILEPKVEAEAMCRKLGFVGEFKVVRSGNDWLIKFATGEDLSVRKKAAGVYYSIVSCAMGCMGQQEIKLNLNTKEFYYWNDIDRKPQECYGKVN